MIPRVPPPASSACALRPSDYLENWIHALPSLREEPRVSLSTLVTKQFKVAPDFSTISSL